MSWTQKMTELIESFLLQCACCSYVGETTMSRHVPLHTYVSPAVLSVRLAVWDRAPMCAIKRGA